MQRVGGDGDSTVIWEPDIHVVAYGWAMAAYLLSETGWPRILRIFHKRFFVGEAV
jgi:hypothetical protein